MEAFCRRRPESDPRSPLPPWRSAAPTRLSPECNATKRAGESKATVKRDMQVRIEQFRSARRIHGGTMKMCAAAIGVKLAKVPIPSRRLRTWVYRKVYGGKYMALQENQLEQPLGEFRSLNALFTRGVRAECRPLSTAPGRLLCPCDSTVQDVGKLDQDRLLTVKGTEYTLDSLLAGVDAQPFADGRFAIFFLSPADCHRVFCPYDAELVEMTHVPGRRLLVHPPYQRKEFPVFSLNERVILRFRSAIGSFVLVMVAGWGVGNISYPYATTFKPKKRKITRYVLPVPRRFEAGDWVATFGLGSTVILITEPRAEAVSYLKRDQTMRYGNPAFLFPTAANDNAVVVDTASDEGEIA
ncbi:MAG: phosphatidylserine decarboxylase [Pirellula sp.]|nr:phosphatidylserine decarboxylase [Pirellula sp.]